MFTIPRLCEFEPKIFYKDDDIIVIDNFYKPSEAKDCIDKINNLTFSSYYNMKHRGIGDDKLLAKLVLSISCQYLKETNWYPNEVNSGWRYIKGDKGYYMSAHFDEPIIKSLNEKAFYSVLIYLDDDNEGDIVFNDKKISFKPKAGRLIIFNQKLLHHSKPSSKEKYFLHSEVMFKREKEIDNKNELEAFDIYKKAQEIENHEDRIKQENIAYKISPNLESYVLNL